jgi:hypothetical protein
VFSVIVMVIFFNRAFEPDELGEYFSYAIICSHILTSCAKLELHKFKMVRTLITNG